MPSRYIGMPSSHAMDVGLVDLDISVQMTPFIRVACTDWTSNFTLDISLEVHVSVDLL